jgi:AAA ATPase domain
MSMIGPEAGVCRSLVHISGDCRNNDISMARRDGAGERSVEALLERERELAEIWELLERAGSGSGSLLVLEGPAGIGKTSLVRAAHALARERGFCVLSARGSDLERDFAYGVVRQLLESRLAPAPERAALLEAAASPATVTQVDGSWPEPHGAGAAPADHRSFIALHGLYRLCVDLAALGPLLISIDDADWSDPPSLRFLAYLSRRLEEHPMLLLLAVRPTEIKADSPALSDVLADPLARLLKLASLSQAAVSALVRGSVSNDADEDFCRACYAATAGNPLLLRELIASLRADGIAPTAAAAELASRAVSRAVLLKLIRLPSVAIELAQAVAILGDGAELRHAAALARIDRGAASEAEAALRGAGIFESGGALRFAHPIVRAAIYDELPLTKRSRAYARGARTLLDDLRLAVFVGSTAIHCARIELLVGDLSTAEEELRRAYDAFASIGEKYLLPAIAALLAQVVDAQDRSDEAEEISRVAEELVAGDDAELRALWPSLRGEVLTWQERANEGERRAREAVDVIRIRAALSRLTTWYSGGVSAQLWTKAPGMTAHALLDLAEVFRRLELGSE